MYLCNDHWRKFGIKQWRKNKVVFTKQIEIQNFERKIKIEPLTFCWEWTACKFRQGYGLFHFNGKDGSAHRFAYEYWKGKIPAGLEIDHLCNNKKCVNPSHLEAVTHAEHMRRVIIPKGIYSREGKKTHCPQGHEYNEKNTFFRKSGRQCKICAKIHQNRRKLRNIIPLIRLGGN